ncbi:MAG: LysR substrate-binding domain-containing protein [Burkholderiaceae bacterium]|jgi:LysR family glycine cleavage system transcriptional activator|nr:LysR substrate-binding domain-containing protein [Burkholderiaceae bacterium]
MKRDLPPLLALRAFDAAGRHLSFSKAAQELCVTQGAVSRQIKILEEFLGVPLFRRLTSRVELTAFGSEYLAITSSALEQIAGATHRTLQQPKELSISLLPSISTLWLFQRLNSFTRAYPEIQLHVSASLDPVCFKRDGVDVALRVGKVPGLTYPNAGSQINFQMVDDWTGVNAMHLWDDHVTPVCARRLLEQGRPLKRPQDLRHFPLIHNAARPDCWSAWLSSNQAPGICGTSTLKVGHSFLAVLAARDCLGVACVPTIEVEALEWRDELVFPFESTVRSAGAYYLLTPRESAKPFEVELFTNWLSIQV